MSNEYEELRESLQGQTDEQLEKLIGELYTEARTLMRRRPRAEDFRCEFCDAEQKQPCKTKRGGFASGPHNCRTELVENSEQAKMWRTTDQKHRTVQYELNRRRNEKREKEYEKERLERKRKEVEEKQKRLDALRDSFKKDIESNAPERALVLEHDWCGQLKDHDFLSIVARRNIYSPASQITYALVRECMEAGIEVTIEKPRREMEAMIVDRRGFMHGWRR